MAFLLLWPLKAISQRLAKEKTPPISRVIPKKSTAGESQNLHIMSAELTKTVCDNLHVERIPSLTPVVLLKIEGKCAHISGHLPQHIRSGVGNLTEGLTDIERKGGNLLASFGP